MPSREGELDGFDFLGGALVGVGEGEDLGAEVAVVADRLEGTDDGAGVGVAEAGSRGEACAGWGPQGCWWRPGRSPY